MKFAYYPGCSAKSTCPELDVSMKAVAKKLGIELIELEVAACTGARQLRARRGMVSGYGMVAYGRGLSCSAAILAQEA